MLKILPAKFSLLAFAALLTAFVLAFSGCTERSKKNHIERGENLLKTRQFQEAAFEFRAAVELDKFFAPAHFGLAKAYEGQERFAETMEELRKTAEFDSNHIEARVKLGNYYLLMQPPQTGESEKLVNQILALDANNIEGHVLKAWVLATQKKPDAQVLEVLNKAISFDPQRVETYLSVARFYASRENKIEAEKTFQKALGINESSIAAHIDYGRFLEFSDRLDEAEKQFRRSIELEPNNREALETLAGFYVAYKKFDRAEEIYKTLANLEPNRPENKIVLADFYAQVDREADAIKVYEEILAAKPEFVKGRARLGELHLQRGDEAGANAQTLEILKRNGHDTAGLLLRARIRIRNGDAETAIKDLQDILKQEPSNKLALYFMSDAQLKTGKIEPARNFVNELERFHPTYLFAQQLKIQISLADAQPEQALRQSNELIERLKNTRPSRNLSERELNDLRMNALTAQSAANLQLGRTDDARKTLQIAQQAAPNSPAVYLHLAKVALRAKNLPEAAGFYNRALQLDPNNFDALSGLINVKNSQKQFAEAHNLVDQKFNNAPNNVRAALLFLKSQIFSAERKNGEAENSLQGAIAADAGYLPAYLAYASLLSNRNETDGAIEKYRTALSKSPEDANILTLIGLLEDGRGNLDAAVENYQKALKINPNQAIAANNLGWLYAESGKGDLDEAVAMVQKIAEKNPSEAGYADTLGWIFHKKGANEMAVAHFRRAVALEERAATTAGRAANPAYRMRLGTALAATGDKPAAKREVETALQNSQIMSQGEIQQAKNLLATLN